MEKVFKSITANTKPQTHAHNILNNIFQNETQKYLGKKLCRARSQQNLHLQSWKLLWALLSWFLVIESCLLLRSSSFLLQICKLSWTLFWALHDYTFKCCKAILRLISRSSSLEVVFHLSIILKIIWISTRLELPMLQSKFNSFQK